jgi:uncharacterized protein
MALRRAIRWRSRQHGGLEQLIINERAEEMVVRSTVIGMVAEKPFGVFYQVNLGLDWRVRSAIVQRTDGVVTTLSTDGEGGWRDAHGERPDLAGCVDIDFEVTPFTNTLPIRRAPLAVGETRQFKMAYIPADSLEPFADEQIYTRLDASRYRFEEADGSFSAEIVVDADGFVTDYPELFEQL